MMRITTIVLILFVVSCSVSLDESDKERIRNDELILVETGNIGELFDFVFDIIFMVEDSNRNEVLIRKIDGIKTESGVMVDNQQFGVLPGLHTFNITCTYETTENDKRVTYSNSDVIKLDLKVGYKYTINSVGSLSTCRFEVKEEKFNNYKLK